MPILMWEYKGVDVIQLARNKTMPKVIKVKNMDGVVCRYVPERTCKPIGTIRYDYEGGYAGFEYETELSCGHKWRDSYGDYPDYCPSCGAKVVE